MSMDMDVRVREVFELKKRFTWRRNVDEEEIWMRRERRGQMRGDER